MNVRLERWVGTCWVTVAEAKNDLTAAGITGVRDQIVGASGAKALGASAEVRNGTTRIGGMDTGYPTIDSETDALTFRVSWTQGTSAATVTNLTLHPDGSTAAWASVAPGDITPALPTIAANTQYRLTWSVRPTVTWNAFDATTQQGLLQITGFGTGELSVQRRVNRNRLMQRVGGLNSVPAATVGMINLIRINTTLQLPPLQTYTPRLQDMVEGETITPITLAANGTSGLRLGPFTFPVITGNALPYRLRWYVTSFRFGTGLNHRLAVDAAQVRAGQSPGSADLERSAASPNQNLDFTITT